MIVGLRRGPFGALDISELLHQATLQSFTAPPPSSNFLARSAAPPSAEPQTSVFRGTPPAPGSANYALAHLRALQANQRAAQAAASAPAPTPPAADSGSSLLLWGGGLAAVFAVGFLMFGRRAAA